MDADLVLKGLADLSENRHTIESCLVRIAANRLSRAGILDVGGISAANAVISSIISFEQALDHRLSRAA